MSAREWLTIALFFAGTVGTVVAWLLKRFIGKVDKLEAAIYGDAGLFRVLAQYVKREDHDVANAELAAQMEKMRLEATEREVRVIGAIERQGEIAAKERRFLQGDLSRAQDRMQDDLAKVNDRIDRLRDSNRRQ